LVKRNFHIKHVSARITLYFSITVIFAFVILGIVIGQLISDRFTAEVDLVVEQKLGLGEALLDNSLTEIKSMYFSLIDSPTLQAQMVKQNKSGGEVNLDDLMAIKSEIERVELSRSANVRSIFMVSHGKILDPIYAAEPYRRIIDDNPEFDLFLSSQLTGRFSAPSTFPMQITNPEYKDKNTITYFGRYYDQDSYEDLGYVAINLTQYSIFNEMGKLFFDSSAQTFVVDENNNILFESSPLIEGEQTFLSRDFVQGGQVKMDGKTYLTYTKQLSSYPSWRIVVFMDYQEVASPINNIFAIILLVALFVLGAVVLVSFSISQKITTPIRAINRAMKITGRGEWPEKLTSDTEDEISSLIIGFNAMVASLNTLTTELVVEQDAKKKIEVAMVQSKLDLLQSQINPHFIHNTLNTMKYMAIKADAGNLADIISSFNSLLRTSMSQNNMMITVMEEVDNLYNYIKIQQERYDADLDFSCDISESAKGIMIPKLILQPLVENALFHGIVPKGSGKIKVSARTAEGRIWLTVWDNGAGISPDILNRIVHGIEKISYGYNQIGLANVSERLVLNYGESSRLAIQSEVGVGTSIGFSFKIEIGSADDMGGFTD